MKRFLKLIVLSTVFTLGLTGQHAWASKSDGKRHISHVGKSSHYHGHSRASTKKAHRAHHYHDKHHGKRHHKAKRYVPKIGHSYHPRLYRPYRRHPIHYHSRRCGHFVNGYFHPIHAGISASVHLGNLTASYSHHDHHYRDHHARPRRGDYYLDSYGVCYSIETRNHRRIYVEQPREYCD